MVLNTELKRNFWNFAGSPQLNILSNRASRLMKSILRDPKTLNPNFRGGKTADRSTLVKALAQPLATKSETVLGSAEEYAEWLKQANPKLSVDYLTSLGVDLRYGTSGKAAIDSNDRNAQRRSMISFGARKIYLIDDSKASYFLSLGGENDKNAGTKIFLPSNANPQSWYHNFVLEKMLVNKTVAETPDSEDLKPLTTEASQLVQGLLDIPDAAVLKFKRSKDDIVKALVKGLAAPLAAGSVFGSDRGYAKWLQKSNPGLDLEYLTRLAANLKHGIAYRGSLDRFDYDADPELDLRDFPLITSGGRNIRLIDNQEAPYFLSQGEYDDPVGGTKILLPRDETAESWDHQLVLRKIPSDLVW